MHAESNSNHGCLAGHVASCQSECRVLKDRTLPTNLNTGRAKTKKKKKPNKSIRTGS